MLLITQEVLASDHGDHVIIGAFGYAYDLVGLSRGGPQQVHLDRLPQLVSSCIINPKLIHFGNQISFDARQIQAHRAAKIIMVHGDAQVMGTALAMDGEVGLVDLVGHAVAHLRTEHHVGAVHVVGHRVLQLWLLGLGVKGVELYIVLLGHLNANVALDIIDEAHGLKCVIELPVPLSIDNAGLSEEQNLIGAADNNYLIKDEHHIAEALVGNLLNPCLFLVINIDRKSLPLTIEQINLLVLDAIE